MCEDNSQDKMLEFVMLSLGIFDKHIKIDPSRSAIIKSCVGKLPEVFFTLDISILWSSKQNLTPISAMRLYILSHYIVTPLHHKAKEA
jgi:hypothetical protein